MRLDVVLDIAAIQHLLDLAERGQLVLPWVAAFARRLPGRLKTCGCKAYTPEWYAVFNDFKLLATQAGPDDKKRIRAALDTQRIRVILRLGSAIKTITF